MSDLPAIPPEWVDPGSLKNAADIQRVMAERVIAAGSVTEDARIAGVDVSNAPRDPAALVHAVVVNLAPDTLAVTSQAGASLKPRFPYVSGFLGFREIPALLDAFRALPGALPDLVMVDGHGVSHPRGLGIAAHLGVVLDIPTIGVAKTILVGQPAAPLPDKAGSRVDLVWRGQVIGAVLRTKDRVSPVYVSVGHRIGLDQAVQVVLAATRRHRLPEPTRQAHLAANVWRRAHDGDAAPAQHTML